MGKRRHIQSALAVAVFLVLIGVAHGAETMLMFVGEDLEVLSIASRREEAAWSAPAIANVVTREEIKARGATSIAEALEGMPGFYMSRTEKGVIPYLRGIQNSALFLYDTVPMNSGVRKSDVGIGHETSLAAIKRLEIVRGAGSVLWGPDAFAGMVNAVPYTGKDFQGVETGLFLSSDENSSEAYCNWGVRKSLWSSFFSVSGRASQGGGDSFNVVKFWNDGSSPEPLETRYGTGEAEDSRYINVYSSLTYSDWLTLSLKLGDIRKAYAAYAVNNFHHAYAWQEKEDTQSQVYKVEASKSLSANTGLRFMGYYSRSLLDDTIVDKTDSQEESSLYGELILEQSLFNSKGLATVGSSFRENDYENVPVWKSYLPDYFDSKNESIVPELGQRSDNGSLTSLFGQYRHELDDLELWAGIRYEGHGEYENAVSYNAGGAWELGAFRLKGFFGTAYRTPFPQQVYGENDGKLEKIKNYSTQLSWKNADTMLSVALFQNTISDHVIEDRYKGFGLSNPNSQKIRGVELEVSHQFTDRLSLAANLTLLNNNGPNESYYYREFSHEPHDGAVDVLYKELTYAYETGPDTMGNIRAVWEMGEHVRVIPELRYFSDQSLYSPVENATQSCGDAWIADLNVIMTGLLPFDMSLHLNNLFDTNYKSPGLYSVIDGPGFSAGIMIRMKW